MRDAATIAKALSHLLQGRVEIDLPLAPYTTYQLGGPADLALLPTDTEDLSRAIAELTRLAVPWIVLGGGSNVLISDRGVRGAVILTAALNNVAISGAQIVAGAGVPSHQLAQAAQGAGLTGAEFLSWLPGSIGGACLMNARAYGGEIAGVLTEVLAVAPDGTRTPQRLQPQQFSYKRSPFQHSGQIIAQATLTLAPGDPEKIRQQMDTIEQHRRQNHELDFPSCGCVFQNDHAIGISSGKLIDHCGLKGLRLGNAQVSPYHGNFVFNLGGATASQVRQLIERVRQTVAIQTGHYLPLEVRLLGQWEE